MTRRSSMWKNVMKRVLLVGILLGFILVGTKVTEIAMVNHEKNGEILYETESQNEETKGQTNIVEIDDPKSAVPQHSTHILLVIVFYIVLLISCSVCGMAAKMGGFNELTQWILKKVKRKRKMKIL